MQSKKIDRMGQLELMTQTTLNMRCTCSQNSENRYQGTRTASTDRKTSNQVHRSRNQSTTAKSLHPAVTNHTCLEIKAHRNNGTLQTVLSLAVVVDNTVVCSFGKHNITRQNRTWQCTGVSIKKTFTKASTRFVWKGERFETRQRLV